MFFFFKRIMSLKNFQKKLKYLFLLDTEHHESKGTLYDTNYVISFFSFQNELIF